MKDVYEKEVDVDLDEEEQELDEYLNVYLSLQTRYCCVENVVNDVEDIFELGETARLGSEVSGEHEPSPIQLWS